ncbi:MAG: glycosyltransferase family 4 protein [Verrucomicrobiales bacterium]|nr:glycosyltransferase family 4 protein [Verrucomicrobiales bacterium]
MDFLFIYSSPGVLGGIETLIVRMSRWLVKNQHRVTLLVESPEHWAHLLPEEVKCVALGKRFPELYYYFHAKRLWQSLNLPNPDVIKSFDIGSSWIACQLAAITGSNSKVLAGIYNPYVFKWYYATESLHFWDPKKLYVNNFLENIPANARLFCGVDQIEELEEVHRRQGVLWPIPIDTREFDAATRKPKWGKIVSVGRLSPMKEYNLYMIEVVKELTDRGHDVSWMVYGTGEYEAPMREAIKKHGLERAITLAGAVPYKCFWQVLEDAYVFVGMGTANLEASLFKVPNVTAVAYDRDGLTWGPVHRLPQGSLGHVSSSPPTLKVVDEIERILRLDPSDYAAEQESVYNHVQVHSIGASMERFIELVREATPIKQKKSLYCANYLFWFLRRALKRKSDVPAGHHPMSILHPVKQV